MSDEGEVADDDAFVPLKFDGGRYTQKGYPLETAGELASYQKLLVEVAKQAWLDEHPIRAHVPKGFEDRFGLRLTRVERGSVIPFTVIGTAGAGDLVERAREAVHDVFAFIVDKKRLPTNLRDGVRNAAKRIGASLQDGEAMHVQSASGAEVKYTQAIRTQMLANEDSSEVEREGTLPGKVVEIEPDNQSFKLELYDGRRVVARFNNPDMWHNIVKFVSPSVVGDIVRFQAKYVESATGEIIRVEDVIDVETFLQATSAWTPRFQELMQLRTGWLDGSGNSIALTAIEYAREVLRRTTEGSLPLPLIYPTPDGGVQLELEHGPRHIELSISPDLLIEGYVLDSSNGEDDEVNPDSPAAAAEFIGRWSND